MMTRQRHGNLHRKLIPTVARRSTRKIAVGLIPQSQKLSIGWGNHSRVTQTNHRPGTVSGYSLFPSHDNTPIEKWLEWALTYRIKIEIYAALLDQNPHAQYVRFMREMFHRISEHFRRR